MSLCSEAEYRASLSDAEFWAHVFGPMLGDDGPDDFGDCEPPERYRYFAPPCTVCGETGACGYDPEGRPLIHAAELDEDDT